MRMQRQARTSSRCARGGRDENGQAARGCVDGARHDRDVRTGAGGVDTSAVGGVVIAGVTIMLLAVWLVFNWLAPLAALRGAVRLSLGRIPGEIVQRAGAERVEFYQAVLDRGYAFSIWSWPHQFVVLDRGFALHAHPAQVRFVLAHELGHGVHGLLAGEAQGPLMSNAPTAYAETASVFGEMLLSESLIEHETNRSIKIHMLCSKLDDIYATIARQIFFTIFEKDAHEAVANGATVKELCEIYLKNLKEQFGNAVNVPKDFKYEWLYVPHIIFSPFYCYAYAFGNLMVFALYEMYKKEGKSFIPKYIRMLSQGGSMPPIKILHELGINPASEKFWQQGFDYVAQQVDELEKLIKQ